MPNWVMCDLKITGEASELDRFAESAKGYDQSWEESALSLQRLVPMPDELIGTEGQSDDRENWMVVNWGTTWDLESDIYVKRVSPNELKYWFCLTWCGPWVAIRTISKEFPSLSFNLRHADYAMDWDQTLKIQDGKKLESRLTTFDNRETLEYWSSDPLCPECGWGYCTIEP
jgi:hypothetical protein